MKKLVNQVWEIMKSDHYYWAAIAFGILTVFVIYYKQLYQTFHVPAAEKMSYVDDLQDRGNKPLKDARV